jgi:hypothetical protein
LSRPQFILKVFSINRQVDAGFRKKPEQRRQIRPEAAPFPPVH